MTASPRIAFHTDSAIVGGAEISLGWLLSELDPKIEAVITGTDRGVTQWLAARRPGAQTRLLAPVRGKADAAALARTIRAIAALRPHIFHANLAAPAASQYALTAATLVPGVRTVAVEQLPYPLHGRLQRGLKRFTSQRLAAHIAVGDRAAREVERFAGLRPGTIRTIHNGVPDLALEPLPRSVSGPVAGTIGRLDRQKGYDVLLRSVAHVPTLHLVLVGDGPERAALEALAQSLGIAERVHFEGWREDARRYLTTFDLFVLPSRFEGFPLSIVEAMLAGLPVVASDVGSVAEAVVDGVTGRLVAADDVGELTAALTDLGGEGAIRDRMGLAGRERAQGFTAAAMARAYERVYAEVLA